MVQICIFYVKFNVKAYRNFHWF